jgi:hypothetical protein
MTKPASSFQFPVSMTLLLAIFTLQSSIFNPPASAITIANSSPTNIQPTSAFFCGNLTATNGTTNAISVKLYYGYSDQTTNAAAWGHTNGPIGMATTGAVSTNITGLVSATLYYFRWYAAEGTNTHWATPSTSFWTRATAPTSAAPAHLYYPVHVNTNGILVAPTNFFDANGIPKTNTTASLQAQIDSATNRVANVEATTGSVEIARAWLQDNTNGLKYGLSRSNAWDEGAANAAAGSNEAFRVSGETNALHIAITNEAVVESSRLGDLLYLLLSGVTPMAGDLNMGGNSVTNVGTNSFSFVGGSGFKVVSNGLYLAIQHGTNPPIIPADSVEVADNKETQTANNNSRISDLASLSSQLGRNDANDAWFAFLYATDQSMSQTPMSDGFRDGFSDSQGISAGSNYTWSAGQVSWGFTAPTFGDQYWPFDDDAASTDVTNAYDASRNATSTVNTADMHVDGKIGTGALRMSGNFVTMGQAGDSSLTDLSKPWSVNLWVNRTNAVNANVLAKGAGGARVWLVFIDNTICVWPNGADNLDGSALVPTNTWLMVTYTATGPSHTLYTNGAFFKTGAGPNTAIADGTFKAGYSDFNTGDIFPGHIDDLRIWTNHTLTADEVSDLWNGGVGRSDGGSGGNMRLDTTATTVNFTPTEGRLFLSIESGSTTQQTDLIGYVSRDNAATWTETVLQDDGPLVTTNTGLRKWSSGLTNFVGAAGSNLAARIETRNNKAGSLRGVALQVR